jgi:ribosomal protein S21
MRNKSLITGLRVEDEGNFEKMMRKFKKKVKNDGRLETLDAHSEYIKPSVLARRARAVAVSRTRREQRGKLDPTQ